MLAIEFIDLRVDDGSVCKYEMMIGGESL